MNAACEARFDHCVTSDASTVCTVAWSSRGKAVLINIHVAAFRSCFTPQLNAAVTGKVRYRALLLFFGRPLACGVRRVVETHRHTLHTNQVL